MTRLFIAWCRLVRSLYPQCLYNPVDKCQSPNLLISISLPAWLTAIIEAFVLEGQKPSGPEIAALSLFTFQKNMIPGNIFIELFVQRHSSFVLRHNFASIKVSSSIHLNYGRYIISPVVNQCSKNILLQSKSLVHNAHFPLRSICLPFNVSES